jgi:hypothetical protein
MPLTAMFEQLKSDLRLRLAVGGAAVSEPKSRRHDRTRVRGRPNGGNRARSSA